MAMLPIIGRELRTLGVVARLVVLEYSGSAAVPHASLAQGDGCHMGEVTGKEGSDLRAAMR